MQQLLERFLGIPPSDPGQGKAWIWNSEFPWPGWALVLFCLCALAYVIVITGLDAMRVKARAQVLLVLLRSMAIAIVLIVLAEFGLTIERTGLPFLVVMLDRSGSMERQDQYPAPKDQEAVRDLLKAGGLSEPTRLNLGKSLLLADEGKLLKSWLGQHKLRIYTIAESEVRLGTGEFLEPAEIDALLPELRSLDVQGDQTRLGEALRRVMNDLRGTPPTAVILITDGVTTDGESLASAARYARQKAIPLYIFGVGNSSPIRDLELHDLLVDEVAFVDDPLIFVYRLTANGASGRTAKVSLKVAGKEQPLLTRDVTLGPEGKPEKLELTYTPTEVGEFEYVLEVQPLPNEADVTNNRKSRKVSVRKERTRVLLVENQPRWEFRELKMLLEREKTVELKVVLQDADPGFADEDKFVEPNFPVKREDLFAYDVVLLGDANPELLGQKALENLRDFVRERGGGLLVISGPQYIPRALQGTPLEGLLPFDMTGIKVPAAEEPIVDSFHPDLTAEGRKGTPFFRLGESEPESRQIWDDLPGFLWFVETPDVKPGATVLATHPTKTGTRGKLPLISMQRFGAGKVLFHATDETWRWRFRVGDLYFGRYWVQAIRYLSRSKQLGQDRSAELTADRREYKVGDEISLRLRFINEKLTPPANDGAEVIVRSLADGREQKLSLARVAEAPNVFEGALSQLAEGSYHAWVSTPAFTEAPPSYDFTVKSQQRERRNPRADLAEMNRSAALTRGKTYTPATVSALADDIPPGFPVSLNADEPIPLWNHWGWIVLFGGVLTAEWLLRKRLKLL